LIRAVLEQWSPLGTGPKKTGCQCGPRFFGGICGGEAKGKTETLEGQKIERASVSCMQVVDLVPPQGIA